MPGRFAAGALFSTTKVGEEDIDSPSRDAVFLRTRAMPAHDPEKWSRFSDQIMRN
jgi:hypothetical protein